MLRLTLLLRALGQAVNPVNPRTEGEIRTTASLSWDRQADSPFGRLAVMTGASSEGGLTSDAHHSLPLYLIDNLLRPILERLSMPTGMER